MITLANMTTLGHALLVKLSGPLLSKELRVAGRRRRNYTLRFAYVIVLTIIIALVWVPATRFHGMGAFVQAQMEAAAKRITREVIWFQFIVAQIVALLGVSAAISDEVYSRTLAVLMTTPMSSAQLVMGKLTSRMFQILLLIATGIPLLAMVRVVGGVPWNSLFLSFIITVVTVVFVASAGLYFSTLCRRAYITVIVGILGVGFLLGFIPFVAFSILKDSRPEEQVFLILSYMNPYVLLLRCMDYMMSPGAAKVVPVWSIISCCAFMMVGSAFFLRASTRLVRQVALRRAMGQMTFLDYLHPKRWIKRLSRRSRATREGIRRVVGPAMVWKEMTCTLSRRQKVATQLVLGTEILLIGAAYLIPPITAVIGYGEAHMAFIWLFLGLGTLFTITVSATLISAERESRTWSLLLATPLRNRDIILGKCAGIVRRCGPVWLPLFAYVTVFALADCFSLWAIPQVTFIILSSIVFLSATGLYFGSRFNRTTDAVTANLLLAIVVWCIIPVLSQLAALAWGRHWGNGEFFAAAPYAQTIAMAVTTFEGAPGEIWCFNRVMIRSQVTLLIVMCFLAYIPIACLFAWRAVRSFRRHIL